MPYCDTRKFNHYLCWDCQGYLGMKELQILKFKLRYTTLVCISLLEMGWTIYFGILQFLYIWLSVNFKKPVGGAWGSFNIGKAQQGVPL